MVLEELAHAVRRDPLLADAHRDDERQRDAADLRHHLVALAEPHVAPAADREARVLVESALLLALSVRAQQREPQHLQRWRVTRPTNRKHVLI